MNNWRWIWERKQEFRKRAVPVFRIEHTKWIEIEGSSYQLYGQKTTNSPIFTNYQVIDREGQEAAAHIAKKVYDYVTKIELLTEFTFLKDLIKEQASTLKSKMAEYVRKEYEKQTGQKLDRLIGMSKTLEKQLSTAHKALNAAQKDKESWRPENLREILSAWERIRKIYERRIPYLEAFRTFIISEQLHEEQLPKGIKELFEEAEKVQNIFINAIQIDPTYLREINSFISLNSSLSVYEETKKEQTVISMLAKLSHTFLSRYIYLVLFLVSLFIFWAFGIQWMTAIGVAYLFLMGGVAHFLRNATLKSDMKDKITTLRTARALETKTISQAYTIEKKEINKLSEFITKRNQPQGKVRFSSVVLMSIGAIISVVFLLTYQTPMDWILILFGIVLVIVGWLLPRLMVLKDKLVSHE